MPIDTSHPFFEDSPIPVFLLSEQGTVTAFNRAARRTLGLERDRVLGRPILAHIVDEDRNYARDSFLRVLEGHATEWTTRFQRGDGALRVQRVKGVLYADDNDKWILLFARDITESREGRPETIQLQTLLENLPGQFVAVLDTRFRIRYSSGLARVQYRDDLEAVGMAFEEILDKEHWTRARFDSGVEAINRGEHWTDTIWLRRCDGETFPARLFFSPYLDPVRGRALGAIVVGQDVSEVHQWQTRARASEHMASLGRLTSKVAAELNAGIGVVGKYEKDPLAVEQGLARLRSLATALSEISGAADIRPEPISLPDLVREALDAPAAGPPISISIEVAEGVTPVVADRTSVRRVIDILVANGKRNIPARAEGSISLRLSGEAHVVTLTVSNSGPPIPGGELDGIFEPKFTTPGNHVGHELALARSIVQAHGGRIWGERDEDGRVSISFTLPTEERRSAFRPKPLRVGLKRSVLVVDDEEDLRSSVRRFLEKVGYDVSEAWSGRSAIAQITAGRPPEVMVTDLRMADGSGSWLLNQISQDFPELLRRTIILTGDPDEPTVASVVRTTGCSVLTKPIDFPDLLEALDQVSNI